MKKVTVSGQTIKDAIDSALVQLGKTEAEVEVEVIQEGKKGLFGLFGSKRAIVNVTEKNDPIELTKQYLIEIARTFSPNVTAKATIDKQTVIYELSGDHMALLIGKRGETLNALSHLVQIVLNRNSKERYRVLLDAENYRSRRQETLVHLAHRLADKAMKTKKAVSIEPMPSYERKIIHSALQNVSGVETSSEGKDPKRHIVISPK